MTVLVAAASRHGSTREIAEEIGGTLERRGLDVVVAAVEEVDGVSGYEAVVLGSAVYIGNWLEPARRFVDAHAAELAERPTWLFSSGPIGLPPKPEGEKAVQIEPILARSEAREHRIFAGKLDRSRLGLGERVVVRAVRADDGDFRDFEAVSDWAEEIAAELQPGTDADPPHGREWPRDRRRRRDPARREDASPAPARPGRRRGAARVLPSALRPEPLPALPRLPEARPAARRARCSIRTGTSGARCSARSPRTAGERVVARRELRAAARPDRRRGGVRGRGRVPAPRDRHAPASSSSRRARPRHGIERFVAEVLADNRSDARRLRGARLRADARARRRRGRGRVPDRARPSASRSGVAERDHVAVTASLRPFFEPRSVAVIGASRAARHDRRRAVPEHPRGRLRRRRLPRQPRRRARSRACAATARSRRSPTRSTSRSSALPGERVLEAAEQALAQGRARALSSSRPASPRSAARASSGRSGCSRSFARTARG